jgi:hypothetical protein
MIAAFDRDPESSRTCVVCGVAGLLGQYIDVDDKLVWAHPRCAKTRELEPVDGGVVTDTYVGE